MSHHQDPLLDELQLRDELLLLNLQLLECGSRGGVGRRHLALFAAVVVRGRCLSSRSRSGLHHVRLLQQVDLQLLLELLHELLQLFAARFCQLERKLVISQNTLEQTSMHLNLNLHRLKIVTLFSGKLASTILQVLPYFPQE